MPRPMPLVIRVANYTQKFSKYFEQEIENGSSTTTQCWKKSTLSQSFLSVVCVFKHCASSRLVKKKNIAQSKAMKMQKTRQQNDTLVAPFFTPRKDYLVEWYDEWFFLFSAVRPIPLQFVYFGYSQLLTTR